ncbi:LacI family DNA-binding transcriptional regulator [Schaedlerella sp.]|uniref:LacI family DNA-binding transcriptional regulator n=1 Tax=Schaedlerella sp. TaxID=2676057 RepID=UPI00260EF003|nr:LacI family DNA-binding transcriptional regulator [uncultured Schaedlerella sp.]
MPATMRDVKNRTGLSMATISKYLNGGNVLPENKILIEEAIHELHYEVNEIARGLVKNKTKIVGVMVHDIACYFSGMLLHYIGQELRKRGYGMMSCDSCNDEEIEAQNLKFLVSRKVDGIIALPVSMRGTFLKPAKQNKIPIVLVDRAFQDEEFDCVGIDNKIAAYRAVDLLLKHNHKKIAVIASDVEYTGIERIKGYEDAMRQAGLEIREEYIKRGRHSMEVGYEKMKELLAEPDRPTAVLMGNYDTMLGGVLAVNQSEFSCPEDISLIGFDNLMLSGLINPSWYMVEQPMERMCMKAVELLWNRMEKKEEEDSPVKICLGTKIQKGESIRRLEEDIPS